MKSAARFGFFLLAFALAGCQSGLSPTSIATPQVISLQASAALQPLQPLFKICTLAQANSALVMLQTSSDIKDSSGVISLRWGLNTQPTGFAAVLGYEELVVVINPQNPTSQLSQEQAQAIWSGALKKWPGDGSVGDIQPWVYPASEDIQQIFEHNLLSDNLPAKNAVYIAPDPAAVIEAVSGERGAVGFIPRRWNNQKVKEIPVEGAATNNLSQPILALTQSQPEGLYKNWLLCLQDQLGK